jgi:pyruvate,orthophosphate dikinase
MMELKILVQIAVDKGKKQNKKIKLGICGEHGVILRVFIFAQKLV